MIEFITGSLIFTKVFLEGKYIGKIVNINNKFQYRPNGTNSKFWGELFDSIDDCKNSLK